MKTVEIGIDWSKDFVDLCAVTDEKRIIEERLAINADGFKRLEQILEQLKGYESIEVAIEDANHIVARLLMSWGFPVYGVNPLALNRYKSVFSFNGQKDDKYDAYCLARFLKQNRAKLKAAEQDYIAAGFSRLVAAHKRAAQEKTRSIQRLRSHLSLYYPSFSGFFKEFTNSSLELLKTFPRPESLLQCTYEEFLNRTSHIKHFQKKRKQAFFECMKKEIPEVTDPINQYYTIETELLIEQLRHNDLITKKLEAAIQERFIEHPHHEILTSIPGCGVLTGARLIAELGDRVQRFPNFKAFQSFAGTSPVTIKSGKSINKVKIRRACRKHLRHTMYWLAFNTITREPWAREYYDQLKARGVKHSAALRTLSNKWAKIIYAMWTKKEPYQRQTFLSRREPLITG